MRTSTLRRRASHGLLAVLLFAPTTACESQSEAGSTSPAGPMFDDASGTAIERLSNAASQLYATLEDGTLVFRNETNGNLEARHPGGALETIAPGFADVGYTAFIARGSRLFFRFVADDTGPLFVWSKGAAPQRVADEVVRLHAMATSKDERYVAVPSGGVRDTSYVVLVKDLASPAEAVRSVTSSCAPSIAFIDEKSAVVALCTAVGAVDIVRIDEASGWAATRLTSVTSARAPKLLVNDEGSRVLMIARDGASSIALRDGSRTVLAERALDLRVDATATRVLARAEDGSLFGIDADGGARVTLLPAASVAEILEVTADFRFATVATTVQEKDLEVAQETGAYVPRAHLTDLQLVSLTEPETVTSIVAGARISPGTHSSDWLYPYGSVLTADRRYALYFLDVDNRGTGTLVARNIATGAAISLGREVSYVTAGTGARVYFEDGYRGPASYEPGFRTDIRSVDLDRNPAASPIARGTNTGVWQMRSAPDTFYFSVGIDGESPGIYRVTAR